AQTAVGTDTAGAPDRSGILAGPDPAGAGRLPRLRPPRQAGHAGPGPRRAEGRRPSAGPRAPGPRPACPDSATPRRDRARPRASAAPPEPPAATALPPAAGPPGRCTRWPGSAAP